MVNLVKLNRKAYNAIATHFSKTRAVLWPEFNEFIPFLHKSQRILDWGCGNGRLIQLLENKGIEYHGIDQSKANLKEARRINSKAVKEGWAHFYSNAIFEKKFPQNYFDNVFMIASFFHLPNTTTRLRLLEKMYKELKPGGRLFILVWNLESDWAMQKKKDWKRLGPDDYLIPWKNPAGEVIAERYYHHFSEREINELLSASNFIIEKIKYSDAKWADDKGGRNMLVIAAKSPEH